MSLRKYRFSNEWTCFKLQKMLEQSQIFDSQFSRMNVLHQLFQCLKLWKENRHIINRFYTFINGLFSKNLKPLIRVPHI